LKNSGAVAFSAKDLEKFINGEDLAAYCAGPQSDYKYTLVATTQGEVTISYFPKNADIHNAEASSLIVQTHNHFSTVTIFNSASEAAHMLDMKPSAIRKVSQV